MDISILSGGAANGLVNRVRAAFEQQTGLGISGDFGAVGAMRDRILEGEHVDVIILTRAILDQLCQSGHVAADSVADLGQVLTGVAVRDGASLPDITTGDGLRTALLAADAIYTPDTVKSTAGIHVASTLNRLGIADQTASKLKEFPNGQTAMAAMAAGDEANPVGCTQITEILNTVGVAYAGDLPAPYGLSTVYTAGVASGAAHADAARALIAILTAPEHASDRSAAGFS